MVIYDFLYLDKDRINAFYAQIFEGLLKEVKQNTTAKQNEAEKVSAGLKPVAYGELAGFKAIEESKGETIDPEQIVILDTLATLSQNAREIEEAETGEIVKVKGNLHIATNNMLKMFVDIGDMFINEQRRSSKEKKELKNVKKIMKSFLDHTTIESIMLLSTGGYSVVGSLKKEFLQEEPDTFQLKYGSSGLDNVYVLGFFESISTPDDPLQNPDDFISSSKQFAQSIKLLFFPLYSFVITPIAIYKEIEISQK